MNFQKISLVVKREYLTRIRSKSFILSTILTPLLLIGVGALSIWIATSDSGTRKTVGIKDETGVLAQKLTAVNEDRYRDVSELSSDSLKKMVLSDKLDAYVILGEENIGTDNTIELIYGSGGGLVFTESVQADLRDVIREERLLRANVTEEVRQLFIAQPRIESRKLTETGDLEKDHMGIQSAAGFILGLLIFIGLFGYGAMIMRSVIEEKTSRIVEIITSSIKPAELLAGKLIGVCLVGFTQFAAWFFMYVGIAMAAVPFLGFMMQDQLDQAAGAEEVSAALAESGLDLDPATLNLLSFDPMIIVYFFLFFVFGFFMYASLFAAFGAAADSEEDTQQFIPILMIPIMIAYIFNTRVMLDPDTPMAVFASVFPLTSPINMVTRLAVTDVPFWEIALSLVLLVGSFLGMMWMSAKIYRIGILMYGKKAKWSDLIKWVRQS